MDIPAQGKGRNTQHELRVCQRERKHFEEHRSQSIIRVFTSAKSPTLRIRRTQQLPFRRERAHCLRH